jgi:hypothetical protein
VVDAGRLMKEGGVNVDPVVGVYCDEVRTGVFPAAEHNFGLPEETLTALKASPKTG